MLCTHVIYRLINIFSGAVRPPPEAWNRNSNSSRDFHDFGYDTTYNEDPYVGSVGGGRVGDTKMLKIGLGVFGGIALILGTMLSYFYIQKKNKDDKHKRQRAKNQSPGGGRGSSPNNIPYPGHPFPGNYPYPGAYEQAAYDHHQLPPGPYEGIPGPVGPCPPGQPGQYPPQYPYEAQYYPYMQQYDEFAVPPQYMTPEQDSDKIKDSRTFSDRLGIKYSIRVFKCIKVLVWI